MVSISKSNKGGSCASHGSLVFALMILGISWLWAYTHSPNIKAPEASF